MWHPSKNEGWTPQTISVASDVEVWWVCPLGHEWREAVRDRAAARKWKRGNVDACGVCLGYHALQACACGQQQRLVKAKPPSSDYECSACYREDWGAAAVSTAAGAGPHRLCRGFAASQELLDRIVPARLPPALAVEWRCAVGPRLRRAMEDELGYGEFGTVGAIDDALRRIQAEGDLLPTADELRAAHAAGEPVRFMDRTFWTQGVLYVLGLDDAVDWPRDRAEEASLEQWVRANVGRVVNRHHPRETHDTATLTRVLTDLVEQWGQRDETGPWRSFFELVPPFIPTTGAMCGKFDVVLTRAGSPDLVVEIDSAHHPRSMEKLRFAHAAGATATWIRWNSGTARKVPGVHVIDLIGQTKRVTRA